MIKVSKYFTINDLTRTDTGIANAPPTSLEPKLILLGKTLDTLYEKVGPFKIISAYRAPAVQSALKSGGNVQAVSKSYHSTAQAADIMPTSMSVQDFFAKLTQSPVKDILGGYAIKQNVLHIDTDTSWRKGVAMYVDKAGQYIRFSATELKNFIAKNKVAVGGGLAVLLIGGAVAFYLISKKGKK